MIDEAILDPGFGDIDNIVIISLLENMSPDERKKAMIDLKNKNTAHFKEFCEMYSDKLEELGLEEYI